MPIFDYMCPKCKAKVEKMVRVSDERVACEGCGWEVMTKLPSSPSFRLYGEGFHRRNHRDTGEFAD